MVLRDIQGSINSLGSSGGARLSNSSGAAGGSAGVRAVPARASAVGKLKCVFDVDLVVGGRICTPMM